jgi:GT2 family glycosyltransferase
MTAARLTIGITTRDRPAALERCLRSLSVVGHLAPEVLVFDDASSMPVAERLAALEIATPLRVVRDRRGPGYIAGRNVLVREASAPLVLLMDDDAALLDSDAIERAVRLAEADAELGAVAFAQCDRVGVRWDDAMQPSRARTPCYVPSFIGFAHLLRRDTFVAVGGYRESFEFYGEEKDFCLRLIDAGHRTLYLPDALVIHEPDEAGRSMQRYLRYVTRNDCLTALYNEPFGRLIWLLPARLALYFRMRRAWRIEDPWGWAWILRELSRNAGDVLRARKPVSRETVATWRRLRAAPESYPRTVGLEAGTASREPRAGVEPRIPSAGRRVSSPEQ